MIIGSDSASFEILRYLVERLPVMITPKWVITPCQPIAVRNVIGYLVGVLAKPETTGGIRHRRAGNTVLPRHYAGISIIMTLFVSASPPFPEKASAKIVHEISVER